MTEDELNQIEPLKRFGMCRKRIMSKNSGISQRADALIVMCELYQKLSDGMYNLDKKQRIETKEEIESVIRWMMDNENNCVIHHELFYQIAARNMYCLVDDMAFCAKNSKSIVSRHEAIENLGMMMAWQHLDIIKNALDDKNQDIVETAQWAMSRYERYKDSKWESLDII